MCHISVIVNCHYVPASNRLLITNNDISSSSFPATTGDAANENEEEETYWDEDNGVCVVFRIPGRALIVGLIITHINIIVDPIVRIIINLITSRAANFITRTIIRRVAPI